MAYSEQEIQDFSLLIRQLLLKYKEMRQELNDMKRQFAAQEKYVKEMEVLANASMHDYDMLKAARIIESAMETWRQHANMSINSSVT